MKAKIELNEMYRCKPFIKEWRKHKNLSQVKLAERLGVTQSEVSKLERDDARVQLDAIEAIAFVLGVDVADLLTVNPLQPDPPKLVYSKMLKASPELQKQVLNVVDAMLKEAS